MFAQVKLALRWLSVDAGGNPKSGVHRLGPVLELRLRQIFDREMVIAAHVKEALLVFFQNKAG